MNRFRTKKKVKEDVNAAARSSSEEQHSFMGFRRNKKAPEEEKKEIDLANALPPSDDFRTSLLMTGLSARFSMLREQDDPNTKIGKASDDSVLFPKRHSRLMDLGFRGLDDIAEVESIKAPAPFMRTNSYASDSDSVQDSIMNRTRPTEGNNLFGGRQKIYRIPVGSTSSKNVTEGGSMGGRALYESDVALSAFQKLRQKEKERFLDDDDEQNTALNSTGTATTLLSADISDSSSFFPRSESPSPVDYNLRRTTSSTTSSGARNSTAATSVTSQPGTTSRDWQSQSQMQSSQLTSSTSTSSTPTLERSTTRIRRLYEQGLNQDLHEHQSSALSRFDTLTGKRLLGSKTPDGTNDRFGPSTGAVNSALERLERRQALAKSSAPNLRSISPPMTGSSAGSPALNDSASLNTSVGTTDARSALPNSPPLSPPVSDSGDHPILAIQPNDLGKATALGMFQKPALPYDESRFAQRQLQLQQGRETPTERFRPESDDFQSAGMSSRSSSTTRQPQQAAPAKASPSPGPVGTSASTVSVDDSLKALKTIQTTKTSKTFLFDDEDDDDSTFAPQIPQDAVNPQVVLQRPSDAEHPAFRQSALPTPLQLNKSQDGHASAIPEEPEPTATAEDSTSSKSGKRPVDSPTLGPASGLSGMVLQHLRSTSNASSIYSTLSPQNNDFDAAASPNRIDPSIIPSLDIKSNLWDDQDWTASVYNSIGGEGLVKDIASAEKEALRQLPPPRKPVPETPKPTTSDLDSKAPSLRSVSSRSRLASITDSTRSSNNLDKEDDEDDFASQLASARRRVQERLTTYVESDSSRNTSPLLAPTEPAAQPPPIKSNPLGILRAKSSRGSLMERSRDVSQSKAMKMLGIGSATMSTTPSPSKQSFDESQPSPNPGAANLPNGPDATTLGALKEEREEKQPEREDAYSRRLPPAAVAGPASVSAPRPSTETDGGDADGEVDAKPRTSESKEDETNMHPGLRAFRNARRQLQKQKELETMARHHGDAPTGAEGAAAFGERQSPPRRERRGTQTTPNRDRGPPPVLYKQRDPSEESRGSAGNRSRSDSRASGQTERERSGSDTSNNGSYTRHAPPRLRNNPPGPSHDGYQQNGNHLGPLPRQGVPMRSPGLPGTDIRHSPHMPPQSIHGGPSSSNLSVQTAMGGRSPSGASFNASSGQPSPISPLGSAGLPQSPMYPHSANASGPPTPAAMGPRMTRQGAPPQPLSGSGYSTTTSSLNETMKKMVKKNDISEPKFLMSTTRVPTVNLPQSASAPDMSNGNGNGGWSQNGPRSRAGSNAATAGYAPPLPPVNPARKQPGTRGPRGIISTFMGRRGDGDDMDMMTSSTPHLPLTSSASSTNLSAGQGYHGSVSDNDDAFEQRTLRKQASEASGMHSRMMGAGLPTQRMDLPGGMI